MLTNFFRWEFGRDFQLLLVKIKLRLQNKKKEIDKLKVSTIFHELTRYSI